MDEGEKAATPVSSGTVSADCGVVREGEKFGFGGEFGFLNAGY